MFYDIVMRKIQCLKMMNLGSGSYGRKGVESLGESDGYHHHKAHHFHHLPYEVLLLVLIFCAVSLSTLLLYHWSYYIHLSPNSLGHIYSPNEAAPDDLYSMAGEGNDLEKLLKRAAFVDRTVIITTLNAAWTSPNSVFDLFLESFRIGNQTHHLLNHLLVVTLDEKAHSRCLELHPYCYDLHTDGLNFSGEAYFMSSRYLEMMWARIDFLRTVLEKGYSFVFTDADIMWLRNPFLHFHKDAEFQIACDHFYSNSSDLNNMPNGGFNYVKSSTRTVQFYKFWYNVKDYFPGSHDQDVLNRIKFHPYISSTLGLKITFLDTKFYSGFCELGDDIDAVITVHANCCVGLENKIHDLRLVLDVWKEYSSMSDEERSLEPLSWGLPQLCGNIGGDVAVDNSTTL